jgi:hypothetical protein
MTGYNGRLWHQERELQSKKSHTWAHVKRREGKAGGRHTFTDITQPKQTPLQQTLYFK